MGVITVWKACTSEEGKGISEYHFHHGHCELLLLLEGSIEMNIAGKNYRLDPNQMAVVSHLEPHDLKPLSYPYARIGIHIDSKKLHECGIPPRLLSVLFYRGDDFSHVFDFPRAVWLVRQIYEEYASPKSNSGEMIDAYFYSLMLHLQRQNASAFSSGDLYKNLNAEDARRFIELHCSEKILIRDLAKNYFLSPSYFISLFRRYTGYTPKKYLLLCRLAQARKLLLETDLSVKEVAVRAGYESSNDFVRGFRESMGITPGVFRERYEKNDIK